MTTQAKLKDNQALIKHTLTMPTKNVRGFEVELVRILKTFSIDSQPSQRLGRN